MATINLSAHSRPVKLELRVLNPDHPPFSRQRPMRSPNFERVSRYVQSIYYLPRHLTPFFTLLCLRYFSRPGSRFFQNRAWVKEEDMATSPNGPAASGANQQNIKLLVIVLVSGSLGGLLYWVVALWTGTPLPTVFGWGTPFVLLFVGALAGAIGVYALTTSDPGAIRTWIFACLCGLAWKPVIDSGINIVNNRTATNQEQQVGNSVQQIKTAASSGNAQQITQAVQSSVPAVTQALSLSSTITDANKKAEMLTFSKNAVAELQSSAAKAPEASVDALTNISSSAVTSGEPSVALRAIEGLQAIGAKALQGHDQTVTNKVAQSLSSLAKSSDPSVRSAAQAAATRLQ
jgi:hypothetical protein